MAAERVKFDPAKPETGMLWGLTEIVPTGKFIEVTPESFPWLFRGQPDLLEQYSRGGLWRLHTYYYATRPLDLADLLRLPHWRVDPVELACRQILTSYPSVVIKAVDWTNGPKVFRKNPVNDQSKPGQNFVAAQFTEDEKAVDLTKPTDSRLTDSAVNTYFAFHLIMLPEFSTPDQLIKYTQQRGIPVDLTLLHDGFISLVAKNTIRQLTEQQLLKPALVEDFYGSAAKWQKMLALKRVAQPRISQTSIVPYPINRRREQLPEIRFVPYLALAWHDFLLDLPLHIAAGGQYPLLDVYAAFRGLDPLMDKILCENIKDELGIHEDKWSTNFYRLPDLQRLARQHRPEIADEVAKAASQVKALLPAFKMIWDKFKKSPRLLNGTNPNDDSRPDLSDYLRFRQEILFRTLEHRST